MLYLYCRILLQDECSVHLVSSLLWILEQDELQERQRYSERRNVIMEVVYGAIYCSLY